MNRKEVIEYGLNKIEKQIKEVLSKHKIDNDFSKKMSETREENPLSIQQMMNDDCGCGCGNKYISCCLYEETYDKSLFPKSLQDERVERLLGFKPRVYSDKEMERSGIKHINKYELSVLDVMGNILNLFSSSSEKTQYQLFGLNIGLWGWLIKQDNPYNLFQIPLLKPTFYETIKN
jgi:hypothetical protein